MVWELFWYAVGDTKADLCTKKIDYEGVEAEVLRIFFIQTSISN